MSDDIVVYNLYDDGTPVESVASQPSTSTGASVVSDTSSEAAPTGSAATPITEGDVRVLIKQELSHYSGDIRVGALLSGQVFILDSEGLRLGGTNWLDAPFRVDYDGNLVATSATVTIASLGGFDIGADYVRDTANSFGLASTVSGSDDVRFWAGAAFSARATAPARIYESGVAFFSDVTIAGTIRSSVFEKDVVSAVGGQLVVANADVLDTAMTALDSSTLTIKGETTFAVNDMLHIKDGTDEEYLRVTSAASAPTYSVTRDLAGAYSSNSNPAWGAGTAVVVEGSSDGASTYSGGYLRLLGSGTNSPRYSVFARTGVAYNAVTEYIGLGNLNGLLDYVSEIYGISIGTSALGFLSFDAINGLRTSGKVISQQSFISGQIMDAGSVGAIESDGLMYRSRALDLSTQNTEVAATSNTTITGAAVRNFRLLHVSPTIDIWLRAVGAGGAGIGAESNRIVVSPTTNTITSAVRTELGGSGTSVNAIDGATISSTSILAVYNSGNSATVRIYARVLSGLDVGTTSNAEVAFSGSGVTANGEVRLAKLSASSFMAFYRDSSNDIRAVPITVSGTTPTFGSATTILSHASDQYEPYAAEYFEGSTTEMCLLYRDQTNAISYVVNVTYSGGVVTAGTPVQLSNGDTTGVGNGGGIGYLAPVASSTKMAVFYKYVSGNNYAEYAIISRSGTTLTIGTPVVVINNSATNPLNVSIARITGTYTYAIGYVKSSTVYGIALLNFDGTSLAALGSEITSSYSGGLHVDQPLFAYHSPGRILMCGTSSTNTRGYAKTIDLSTNYSGIVGVIKTAVASGGAPLAVLNGENTNVSSVVTGTEYYADLDGGLISAANGGTKRVGVAHGTTKIIVQV